MSVRGSYNGLAFGPSSTTAVDGYITVAEAAVLTKLTERHVRRLLQSGQLAGRKLGRDWFAERRATMAYASAAHPPGPRPKPRRR